MHAHMHVKEILKMTQIKRHLKKKNVCVCSAHLLNSSMGLLCVCVCCSARGSSLRLLEKQCRCLTSRRTASTCSSVGLKGSCRSRTVRKSYCHKAIASLILSLSLSLALFAHGYSQMVLVIGLQVESSIASFCT